MLENIESIQAGFRLLLPVMSGYIGQQLRRVYRNDWWDEVLYTLKTPYDLPRDGTYAELTDALDVACCLKLLDWKWNDVFRDRLPQECRAWVNELKGIRNLAAHFGAQDADQHLTERALDTMALLCEQLDRDGAEAIRTLYRKVRAQAAPPGGAAVSIGPEQPIADPARAGAEGSLLRLVGTPMVEKTVMTRKVTYGGRTQIYPVYRVRLDALYYNDQNDRIATWITRYEAENGEGSLSGLDREIYNMIIENFIVDSNPDSIRKTQKNIALVGQREPGVALADGRIVDGNRRFTCLRRIQRVSPDPVWFETVLMDMDIQEDRKQIKLLELAIQHGEEKKVDYDGIDFAVGTYRDIVETRLLTPEEYARGSGEPLADVRRRLDIAGLICEFLDAVRLSGQYHVAREYKVYDLFAEMLPILRQLEEDDRAKLKAIAFDNAVLGGIADQRKFIRDVKTLVRAGDFRAFFDTQLEMDRVFRQKLAESEIRGKDDLDRLAMENGELAEQTRAAMEQALQRSRSRQLRSRPVENAAKCVSLLLDIDTRQFSRMDAEEREILRANLAELSRIADSFRRQL